MLKAAPDVDSSGRARMCMLALALPLLCQGVPFTHAGDDMLRSKSLDRDSYNSGDWFNQIDWSMQDNNYGIGIAHQASSDGFGVMNCQQIVVGTIKMKVLMSNQILPQYCLQYIPQP